MKSGATDENAPGGLRLGLRGRYTLLSAALMIVAVLVLTTISYMHARTLMREITERQLQRAAEGVAEHFARYLTIATREVRALAVQPLIANGLLDSDGRDAYLRPFLERHQLPIDIDYNLVLTDHRGESLVARRALQSFRGASWLEAAMDRGQVHVGIESRDGDAVLTIAVPVEYRFTGTREGVLALVSSLGAWLDGHDLLFAEHVGELQRVELLSGGRPILQRARTGTHALVSASAVLAGDSALPADLSVRVSMDQEAYARPLQQLLGEHLAWGMIAVLLVAGVSAVVGRAQASRIEDLAGEARSIADTGSPRAALTRGRFGDDEIGDLALGLGRLLGELKAHQGELESLVALRTAQLAAREADLNRAQTIAHIGSWVYHPDSAMFELSAESAHILGVTEGQALSFEELLQRVHVDDRALLRRAQALAHNGGGVEFEHRLVIGGETRWVSARMESLLDAEGQVQRNVGTLQDITAQRLAEARMREALTVFEASAQGIMTTDPHGVIVSANPAFCRITGYAAAEVVGHTPAILRSGRHDEAFYQQMWSALVAHSEWEGEIWNRRKNGEIYPQWLTISAVRDAGGAIVEFVALFSDISERKLHEQMIWRQANYDALTGLANRSLLQDRMEHALLQARRAGLQVGVLFVDLDGFKWVNDTHGHNVGDDLLIEVAARLKACVREEDTVARLGGDEFTIVVSGLHEAETLRGIGDKVLEVLRAPFMVAGGSHQVSGSLGITVFPDDGESVQELLRNADIAMYQSKQAGKNRLHFYAAQMQADVVARLRVEGELRRAIMQSDFVLEYQPIVDAGSGHLVGAEALIRWLHAERGMVPPGEFISVAEDCGLILSIGEWALREAARQWQLWHAQCAAPLRLSVNVSGIQFRDERLAAMVASVLEEFAIDRGALMLEICESVLIDGSAQAEARMRAIKGLGIGYALDDFGTGFSSLSYLKRFPVDVVKIDRSFVRDCIDDASDALLVEAIINMAHSLGLKVTAEGVETEAQALFLRELGCDYLQGFLIGRPMSAEAFTVFIGRHCGAGRVAAGLAATAGGSAEVVEVHPLDVA